MRQKRLSTTGCAEMLAQLRKRIAKFTNDRDPAAVTSDETRRLAEQIARQPTLYLASDLEVLNALGWLHRSRCTSASRRADPDTDQHLRRRQFFEPVYGADLSTPSRSRSARSSTPRCRARFSKGPRYFNRRMAPEILAAAKKASTRC